MTWAPVAATIARRQAPSTDVTLEPRLPCRRSPSPAAGQAAPPRTPMTLFVVRRLAVAVPMLLGLSVVTFVLLQLAPNDPALYFLPANVRDPSQIDRVPAVGPRRLDLRPVLPLAQQHSPRRLRTGLLLRRAGDVDHQRAARPDAPDPGDLDRLLAGGRCPTRGARCGPAAIVGRQHADGKLALRAVDAELLVRPAADHAVLAAPRVAAHLRHRRGSAGRSMAVLRHARARARAVDDPLVFPLHAGIDGADAQRGLHPRRSRPRAQRAAGVVPPRLQAGVAAAAHDHRARRCRARSAAPSSSR